MSVQVPDMSGAQHPVRKVSRQLVSSGLLGSEQGIPPSPPVPPVPVELDEELLLPPPMPIVVLVVVVVVAPEPPEPIVVPLPDEDEQAAPTAAIPAKTRKERDISSLLTTLRASNPHTYGASGRGF